MVTARTDTYDRRAEILGSLIMRNRLVGALRIAVPALGLAAFAVLVSQIYLNNMLRQYGVSGIRIDRGNMVVDAPRYSGAGTDGSTYLLTAREAATPLDNADRITMTDPTLQYVRASGGAYFASAPRATMNTATQVAVVPDIANVTGDDGLEGTLSDVTIRMGDEIIRAEGAVDLLLPDGTTITGSSMVHDGKAGTWTFTDAVVTMKDLPEAEEP